MIGMKEVNPMIRAAVFDLDHTLYDRYGTLRLIAPMFREHFAVTPGVTDEFIAETICWADRQFVHRGWHEILQCLIDADVFETPPPYPEYEAFLLGCFTKVAVPFPFTIPMLETLRERGVLTGLITNGKHAVQTAKLHLLGLEDKFDAIVISGDTPYQKPQPEIFQYAAGMLGVTTAEMMYVGDHPKFDVDGSRAAGCTPVWVMTTGTWIYPEIEKPPLRVETVEEIPPLLAALNGANP